VYCVALSFVDFAMHTIDMGSVQLGRCSAVYCDKSSELPAACDV